MTEKIHVRSGTELMIGAPANPMPEEISDAIAQLVAQIDGVQEAHLPQCYVPDMMEQPGQILILAIAPKADVRAAMEHIGQGLRGVLSEGEPLDIWPLQPPNPLLDEVRKADCQIYGRRATATAATIKPWWKFW